MFQERKMTKSNCLKSCDRYLKEKEKENKTKQQANALIYWTKWMNFNIFCQTLKTKQNKWILYVQTLYTFCIINLLINSLKPSGRYLCLFPEVPISGRSELHVSVP